MGDKPIRYTRQFNKDFEMYKHLGAGYSISYGDDKNDLYSVFDIDGNGSFDLYEIEGFFYCLKGGDERNNDFVIDEECLKRLKEQIKSGIPEKNLKKKGINIDNISLTQIQHLTSELTKNIYTNYSYEMNTVEDLYVDKNLEQNLSNLQSDITIKSNDERFKNILKIFDTEVTDGKLSASEVKNIWNEISTNLLTKDRNNFDKKKVMEYLKANSQDKNLTLEDFVSFVKTINLATQNRNSTDNIEWKTLGITKPNTKIEGDGNCVQMTGDCYLTGTLLGMSLSKIGRNVLDSLISKDDKGNVYVHLKGAKETYVITPEDFKNSGRDRLLGDGDLRAIELAFEKHRNNRNQDIDGGDSRIAMFLITGIDTGASFGPKVMTINNMDEFTNPDGRNYKKAALNKMDTERYCITAATFYDLPDVKVKKDSRGNSYRCYDNIGYKLSKDGTRTPVEIYANHQYVVSRTDEDKIYLLETNSTDGNSIKNMEIEMSKNDFFEKFSELSYFDLTQNQISEVKPFNQEEFNTFTKNHKKKSEELFTITDWRKRKVLERLSYIDGGSGYHYVIRGTKDEKENSNITLYGLKTYIKILKDKVGTKGEIDLNVNTIEQFRKMIEAPKNEAPDEVIIELYNDIMNFIESENQKY